MKLNEDCIRDILLTVENITGYAKSITYPMEADKCPLLEKYDKTEVLYHINQCIYSGLILKGTEDINGNIEIRDLTPDGHKFISNIREDTNWNNVKSIARKVGSNSLDALEKIAIGVITNLIKEQLK